MLCVCALQVTHANRQKFHDLLLRFRLHEVDVQCDALRRGLATVVPYPMLSLLSWRQLEQQVCGGEFNLALFKKKTCYEGFTESSATIRLFWQMMERFDDTARAKFLFFVWGRSRLPTRYVTMLEF